eukprot:EC121001.1.p1 GENE.EC121001.1~~EC121001.1.p1  ORF type:complete len:135 (+),score=12.04 EC121001.1:71-475(+)
MLAACRRLPFLFSQQLYRSRTECRAPRIDLFPRLLSSQVPQKNMVVVEAVIFPVGTPGPSVSPYVVAVEKILREAEDLKYQLTPMGTIIEGDLDRILETVRKMHEAPFQSPDGEVKRVYTILHIDDRRDKDDKK